MLASEPSLHEGADMETMTAAEMADASMIPLSLVKRTTTTSDGKIWAWDWVEKLWVHNGGHERPTMSFQREGEVNDYPKER